MRKRRAAVRRKRQPIYKPDYAGVHQIAVAKRIVGIALAAALILGIGALLVVWLIPSLWAAMQTSPVVLEEREQAILERAEETGEALREDPETDLPLYEDNLNLFVINEKYPAADFEPELETVSGIQVDWRIAPALEKLVEDAWAQDMKVELISGYISYEAQLEQYMAEVQRLMDGGSTKIMAYEYAKEAVLPPGECDLQSGLCVTLKGDPDTFGTTEICSWLENNMGTYGFVFRYPEGKDKYTREEGTKLVLRYVGPEHAAVMRRLSMSLEEYIDYLA